MNSSTVDILLVDDNFIDTELAIREFSKNQLANKLFHVRDGEEALQFVFATGKFSASRNILQPPSLILLDIQMPKIDGIEVLAKIKSDERTKSIPVVMLTSSNKDPHIKKCYALGACSYIVKPLEYESFTDAIKHIGFSWLLVHQPPA